MEHIRTTKVPLAGLFPPLPAGWGGVAGAALVTVRWGGPVRSSEASRLGRPPPGGRPGRGESSPGEVGVCDPVG